MSHFGMIYGLGVCHACQDYMQIYSFKAALPVFCFAHTDVLHPIANHNWHDVSSTMEKHDHLLTSCQDCIPPSARAREVCGENLQGCVHDAMSCCDRDTDNTSVTWMPTCMSDVTFFTTSLNLFDR